MARQTSNQWIKDNWIILGITAVILSLFWKHILGWGTFLYNKLTSLMDGNTNNNTPGSNVLQTNSGTTRGLRNNNPGNIKYSDNNAWDGKIEYAKNTDSGKTYEQFVSMPYGIRASLKLLQNYIKDGHATPAKIAKRWAEDAPGYSKFIADYVGISQDTAILLNDSNTIKKMAMAIFKIETGRQFSTGEIEEGWKLL